MEDCDTVERGFVKVFHNEILKNLNRRLKKLGHMLTEDSEAQAIEERTDS